jgi:hypothetical protein
LIKAIMSPFEESLVKWKPQTGKQNKWRQIQKRTLDDIILEPDPSIPAISTCMLFSKKTNNHYS